MEKRDAMSEFFERNFQVIEQRWPALAQRLLLENAGELQADLVEGLGSTLSINGIQLTSRHDRLAEAALQAASLLSGATAVHVYGDGERVVSGKGEAVRVALGVRCIIKTKTMYSTNY